MFSTAPPRCPGGARSSVPSSSASSSPSGECFSHRRYSPSSSPSASSPLHFRRLTAKLISRLRQPEQGTPHQPVRRHHHQRHHNRRKQQNGESPPARSLADDRAKSDRLQNLSLDREVLSNNARVPRTTRSRHQTGDKKRKYAWKNHRLPTLDRAEAEQRRNLLQIGRDSNRTSNDVEQDVPLRTKQHRRDGTNTH